MCSKHRHNIACCCRWLRQFFYFFFHFFPLILKFIFFRSSHSTSDTSKWMFCTAFFCSIIFFPARRHDFQSFTYFYASLGSFARWQKESEKNAFLFVLRNVKNRWFISRESIRFLIFKCKCKSIDDEITLVLLAQQNNAKKRIWKPKKQKLFVRLWAMWTILSLSTERNGALFRRVTLQFRHGKKQKKKSIESGSMNDGCSIKMIMRINETKLKKRKEKIRNVKKMKKIKQKCLNSHIRIKVVSLLIALGRTFGLCSFSIRYRFLDFWAFHFAVNQTKRSGDWQKWWNDKTFHENTEMRNNVEQIWRSCDRHRFQIDRNNFLVVAVTVIIFIINISSHFALNCHCVFVLLSLHRVCPLLPLLLRIDHFAVLLYVSSIDFVTITSDRSRVEWLSSALLLSNWAWEMIDNLEQIKIDARQFFSIFAFHLLLCRVHMCAQTFVSKRNLEQNHYLWFYCNYCRLQNLYLTAIFCSFGRARDCVAVMNWLPVGPQIFYSSIYFENARRDNSDYSLEKQLLFYRIVCLPGPIMSCVCLG